MKHLVKQYNIKYVKEVVYVAPEAIEWSSRHSDTQTY